MKRWTSSLLAATALTAIMGASPVIAQVVADNTPPGLALAQDRGVANSAQVITVTVHLKLRNQDLYNKTAAALYDPTSPMFHQWLTDADLQQFAPTAAQMAVVRAQLEQNGLTIVSTDRNGFTLRARGALGDVARAFNTEIHEFSSNGQVFRANIRNASLSGAAGSYVSVVAGLESHTIRPALARAINMKTKQPYATVPASKVEAAGGLGSLITSQALSPAQTFSYTTPGAALPTATYGGVLYDTNPNLTPDFTATALEAAYGLPAAYKQGLDGTGQTIVLLEGYGYPTIQSDANEFNKLNNLPALTSKNFQIVYPEGPPADPNAGILTGWNTEIALDVQWAHAAAPGAKILVVASNGQDGEDFQYAMQYIIDNKLGTVVSDSWEEDTDIVAGPAEQESYENILTVAAMKGISFQFSAGDGGDSGLGTPVGAAGVPSVSPHATAVGGTALLNNVGGKGYTSVGWGDAESFLDSDGPFDPPETFYLFGGGGGSSVFWPKPVWQASLPGVYRQTPDVSALSDPYTGVPIVVTQSGTPTVIVGIGGTSLGSPLFTAIWAIATQKAGHALGQAAPTVAGLKSGLIDVLPTSNANNVSGSVTDANGTTDYSTKALFNGYYPGFTTKNLPNFTGALWNQPQYEDAVGFAFGLDSSLTVTKGWDNVTGYGTPDGLNFIDAVASYDKQK